MKVNVNLKSVILGTSLPCVNILPPNTVVTERVITDQQCKKICIFFWIADQQYES